MNIHEQLIKEGIRVNSQQAQQKGDLSSMLTY